MDKEQKKVNNERLMTAKNKEINIPIGKQNVETLIKSGFYADKTKYISMLFQNTGSFYFFQRPRRFGKSVLLDTIRQIAKGNKDLFKNFFIYKDAKFSWKKYSVINLNFSTMCCDNLKKFEKSLNYDLRWIAEKFMIEDKIESLAENSSISYLEKLFMSLKEINSYDSYPIVLIDEYDSPLIYCEKENRQEFSDFLNGFYSILKSLQSSSKFIFVTGATKLSLAGITTGSNSVDDISINKNFAAMLGFTLEDLKNLFFKNKIVVDSVIKNLNEYTSQKKINCIEQFQKKLQDYYEGYYFSPDCSIRVYNPDSIFRFFQKKSFYFFFINSSNLTVLLKKIEKNINFFNDNWNGQKFYVKSKQFNKVHQSIDQFSLIQIMYQKGFLTFSPSFESINDEYYCFEFPNNEIKSILKFLIPDLIFKNQFKTGIQHGNFILKELRNQNWVAFFHRIRSFCLAKPGCRFFEKTERNLNKCLYYFMNGAFPNENETKAFKKIYSWDDNIDIILQNKNNDEKSVYYLKLNIDKSTLNTVNDIQAKIHANGYGMAKKYILIDLNYSSKKLNVEETSVEIYELTSSFRLKKIFFETFVINEFGCFEKKILYS